MTATENGRLWVVPDSPTVTDDMLTVARLTLTQAGAHLEPEEADRLVRLAQAQATVVLAEEQRLANKIAFLQAYPFTARARKIREEIEEALS